MQDTAGKRIANVLKKREGLTSKEVAEGYLQVKSILIQMSKTKSINSDYCRHSFTLFNIVNVMIALLVVVVRTVRNTLFMSVVLQTVIGIVQRFRRAKTHD